MNLFKTLSVLLLAIAAVQGTFYQKCYFGTIINGEEKIKETTCSEGVTQCLKETGPYMGGTKVTKMCSPNKNITKGCQNDELGRDFSLCFCTGHLCNNASTRGINAILASSCLMVALFKVAT